MIIEGRRRVFDTHEGLVGTDIFSWESIWRSSAHSVLLELALPNPPPPSPTDPFQHFIRRALRLLFYFMSVPRVYKELSLTHTIL